jgi:Ca-activated chloride channel family protein
MNQKLNQKTAQFQQAVLNSSIYHLKVQSSQINLNETFRRISIRI